MQFDRTATVAAGVGTTVLKATAGQLRHVLVTTVGTGICTLYDNATTGSGTVIGIVPASAAAGTILVLDMPAALGITAVNAASGPALTVSIA